MQLDAAATLARRLMDRHGLADWTLVFDNAKIRAGVCRYDHRQIGLSQPLTRLHADDEVRDTILHEIAHALVGAQHKHDRVWQGKAREIGGSGLRCISSRKGPLPGDWVGTCPAGHIMTRHRRPERVLSCRQCSPRFTVRAAFDWTYRGVEAAMHPTYLAELVQLQGREPPMPPVTPSPRALIPRQSLRPDLPVGTPVLIADGGPLSGQTGRVFKRGRTRYEVLTSRGVVSVLAVSVCPR